VFESNKVKSSPQGSLWVLLFEQGKKTITKRCSQLMETTLTTLTAAIRLRLALAQEALQQEAPLKTAYHSAVIVKNN
jgi:hypothetical protein